jgi:hypothetical protein
MVAPSPTPPRITVIAVKLARIGEFKDEWEEFFLLSYQDKLQKRGQRYANRWAYGHAAKSVFFAALEWTKLALIIYLKFAGK